MATRYFYVVNEGSDFGRVYYYNVDAGNVLEGSFSACTGALDIRGVVAHKDTGLMHISYVSTAAQPHRLVCVNLLTEQVVYDVPMPAAGADRPSLNANGTLLYTPNNENFPSSDELMIIDTATGNILNTVTIVDETHNVQVGRSGTVYIGVKSDNRHLYLMNPNTLAVSTKGNFGNILGPYVLNGAETYAVCNVYLDAANPKRVFQVINLATEQIVSAIAPPGASVGDIATTGGDARGNLPHALWWSPDEQRLLTGTAKGSAFMQLWDMTNPMSPQYIQQIALPTFGLPANSVDVGTHWITGTIDGDYVYVGCQKGRQLPTVVFRTSDWAQVTQAVPSGAMLEIDWIGSTTITRVGNQFSNGQVVPSALSGIKQLLSRAWDVRVPFCHCYDPDKRPKIAKNRRLTVELATTPPAPMMVHGTLWLEETGPGPGVATLLRGVTPVPHGSGIVDFGATQQGTPVDVTLTVRNDGKGALGLSTPINLPAGYSLLQSFGSPTLNPNQTTTFQVRMLATAVGMPSGTLTFGTTDPLRNPYSVQLTGNVTTPTGGGVQEQWTVAEGTGFGWGDQTLTFDVSPAFAAGTKMLRKDNPTSGQEIGYQRMAGGTRIAVRIDMPANQTHTYHLVSGSPASLPPSNPVTVDSSNPDYIEMQNGLVGIRIRKVSMGANLTPVHGLRQNGGSWISNSDGNWHNSFWNNYAPPSGVTTKTVQIGTYDMFHRLFTEETPGSWNAAIRTSYTFSNGETYSEIVLCQAGTRFLYFREQSNSAFQHHITFPPVQGNPSRLLTKFRTVTFLDELAPSDTNFVTNYAHYDQSAPTVAEGQATSGAFMMLDNPGWAASAPVWAIFEGRPSALAGGDWNVVNIQPGSGTTIRVNMEAAKADPANYSEGVFEWCLWTGRKDEQFAANGVEAPMILFNQLQLGIYKRWRWRNDFTASANLTHLFMSEAAMDQWRAALLTDWPVFYSYYTLLYQRHYLDYVFYTYTAEANPTEASNSANAFYNAVVADLNNWLDKYHARWGTYEQPAGYELEDSVMRYLPIMIELAKSPQSPLSGSQKDKLAAMVEFWIQFFWDNDYTPQHPLAGINLGLVGQQASLRGQRYVAAGLYGSDDTEVPPYNPATGTTWRTRAIAAAAQAKEHLSNTSIFKADGSNPESPGNYWVPIETSHIGALLGAHQAAGGVWPDSVFLAHFKNMHRWSWYITSPFDYRFNRGRKNYGYGDGEIQELSISELAKQATLLHYSGDAEAQKFARIGMRLWRDVAAGTNYGSFQTHFGLSHQWTDPQIGDATDAELDTTMVSTQFPNTHTHLIAPGTLTRSNESKVFHISGTHKIEHNTGSDMGQVEWHALGGILGSGWGNAAHVALAPKYYNKVLPEVGGALLGDNAPWAQDNATHQAGEVWNNASQLVFNGDGHPSRPRYCLTRFGNNSHGYEWDRELQLFNADNNAPVLGFSDTLRLGGVVSNHPRAITFWVPAENPISTPTGNLNADIRFNTNADRSIAASAGPPQTVGAGVQEFVFTGQLLTAHPQQGVIVRLYVHCNTSMQYFVGHFSHDFGLAQELAQFQGPVYFIANHRLSIRTTGKTTVAVLIYRKGQQPSGLSHNNGAGGNLVITGNSTTLATIPL